jgi:excisionase family DNA binding protein
MAQGGPKSMTERRLATKREAAEDHLHVSLRTVDRLVKSGRLKPVRYGRLVRFWISELEGVFT